MNQMSNSHNKFVQLRLVFAPFWDGFAILLQNSTTTKAQLTKALIAYEKRV